MQATIPLALAATDGRIFECNQAFLDITGLQTVSNHSTHSLIISFAHYIQSTNVFVCVMIGSCSTCINI